MKIKSKTNLKQKQGISLIVLVITIIVMIILAAAIIISLSNNGIIDKANEAVEKTDEKQMQVLATTLWIDAYADDKRDNELVTAVQNGLKAVDANYKEKYIVDITNNGVNLYKPQWEPIYEGDGELTDGMLVVSENGHVFNVAYIYRITLEDENGFKGIYEFNYSIVEDETYMLGAIKGTEQIKFSSFEDNENIFVQIENGAVGIVGMNQVIEDKKISMLVLEGR